MSLEKSPISKPAAVSSDSLSYADKPFALFLRKKFMWWAIGIWVVVHILFLIYEVWFLLVFPVQEMSSFLQGTLFFLGFMLPYLLPVSWVLFKFNKVLTVGSIFFQSFSGVAAIFLFGLLETLVQAKLFFLRASPNGFEGLMFLYIGFAGMIFSSVLLIGLLVYLYFAERNSSR